MAELLEYRKGQAAELARMRANLNDIAELLRDLPQQDSSYKGKRTDELRDMVVAEAEKIGQRLKRVDNDTCCVAVIGDESQGKSTFINAWIGEEVLPNNVDRCTWASTRLINSGERKAIIKFYSREDFMTMIDDYYRQVGLSRADVPFPFPEDFLKSEKARNFRENGSKAFNELAQISEHYGEISRLLDREDAKIPDSPDFKAKIYEYIAKRSQDGLKENGHVYAVQSAEVYYPLKGDETKFSMLDLPGINTPGKRAETITLKEIHDSADIIVFVKNAHNNAELSGTEDLLLENAARADGSVRLQQRIFVILTHADIKKETNGRNAHRVAQGKFLERKIGKDNVFFCSAAAEIGLLNQEEKAKGMRDIATLFDKEEPTTGFPEFKLSIENFMANELPRIERNAFNDLKKEYNDLVKEIQEAANSSRVSVSADISDAEVALFDRLWGNDDNRRSLSVMIKNALNKGFRDDCLEDQENRTELLKGIRENLERIKDEFIEKNVQESNYAEYKYFKALSDRQAQEASFRNDILIKLKDTLYKEALPQISSALKGQIENIWEKMLAATDSGGKGLGVIARPDIIEFMSRRCIAHPSIFREIATSQENASAYFESGFGALFRAALFAPVEYMSSPDPEHEAVQKRILQKAILSRKSLTCLENADLPNFEVEELEGLIGDESKSAALVRKLIENSKVRDLVLTLLPTPVGACLRLLGDTVSAEVSTPQQSGTSSRKFSPFAKKQGSQQNDANAPEDFIAWLQARVKAVFNVLEAMLFDYDFGIMGYYLSQAEQFRHEAEGELHKSLKELARCYRAQIWPEEELFRSAKDRARQQRTVEKILDYAPL